MESTYICGPGRIATQGAGKLEENQESTKNQVRGKPHEYQKPFKKADILRGGPFEDKDGDRQSDNVCRVWGI